MGVKLSPETSAQLQRYVQGELSKDQLDDWLTSAEYDPSLAQAERDALARIRLVAIEVEEGRRASTEILANVTSLLAKDARPKPVTARRISPQ
jgi:hypothetical protein